MKISLTLPYPPSANTYYRNVRGRTLISKRGREYRTAVGIIALGESLTALTGPLELIVDLFPPDRRRRDLDNSQKGLWDAMQHAGCFEDDCQIVRAVLEKHAPDKSAPRAEVVVRPYPGRADTDLSDDRRAEG